METVCSAPALTSFSEGILQVDAHAWKHFYKNITKCYYRWVTTNWYTGEMHYILYMTSPFHALFLIAWPADGDSLMCCIVSMGRQGRCSLHFLCEDLCFS